MKILFDSVLIPFINILKNQKREKIDLYDWIFDDLKTGILKQSLMMSVLLYSLLFLYKLVDWPLGFFLKEAFNTHGIDNKELF